MNQTCCSHANRAPQIIPRNFSEPRSLFLIERFPSIIAVVLPADNYNLPFLLHSDTILKTRSALLSSLSIYPGSSTSHRQRRQLHARPLKNCSKATFQSTCLTMDHRRCPLSIPPSDVHPQIHIMPLARSNSWSRVPTNIQGSRIV